MPSKVPMQSIVVGREIKGKTLKDGSPATETIRPVIGKPFDFTDEECTEILAADPLALRDPMNEGGDTVEDEVADKAAREAAEEALSRSPGTRSAAGDAANTARTAALGKGARKQPDNNNAGEAKEDDEL